VQIAVRAITVTSIRTHVSRRVSSTFPHALSRNASPCALTTSARSENLLQITSRSLTASYADSPDLSRNRDVAKLPHYGAIRGCGVLRAASEMVSSFELDDCE
jgi:hypothetical protein